MLKIDWINKLLIKHHKVCWISPLKYTFTTKSILISKMLITLFPVRTCDTEVIIIFDWHSPCSHFITKGCPLKTVLIAHCRILAYFYWHPLLALHYNNKHWTWDCNWVTCWGPGGCQMILMRMMPNIFYWHLSGSHFITTTNIVGNETAT